MRRGLTNAPESVASECYLNTPGVLVECLRCQKLLGGSTRRQARDHHDSHARRVHGAGGVVGDGCYVACRAFLLMRQAVTLRAS